MRFIRNGELYRRFRAAVEESREYIEKLLTAEKVPIFPLYRVESGTGKSYTIKYTFVPHFRMILNKYTKLLTSLPPVSEVINYIVEHEEISNMLEKMHGGTEQERRQRLESIIWLHLSHVIERVLSKHDLDDLYESYEEYLYSDSVRYTATALLENFSFQANTLDMGDGLTIEKLSDESKSNIYNNIHFYGLIPREHIPYVNFALRRKYKCRKGGRDDSHKQYEIFDRFISALRIFKAGIVGYNSASCFSEEWGGGGNIANLAKNYVNYIRMARAPYELNLAEANELREFWNKVKNLEVKQQKLLEHALRRFNYFYERQSLDDKMVELMIVCESIFLAGAGDAAIQGELSYRMSMRAAFFLGKNATEREHLFSWFKKAYHLRSRIVHGAPFPTNQNITVSGKQMEYSEFVRQTETYIRKAIKAIIENPKTKISDELILS